MHCPSYHFSRNPIKSYFQTYAAKIALLACSSKLLHMSHNKNGISGSFTFNKSRLRIISTTAAESCVRRSFLSHSSHVPAETSTVSALTPAQISMSSIGSMQAVFTGK